MKRILYPGNLLGLALLCMVAAIFAGAGTPAPTFETYREVPLPPQPEFASEPVPMKDFEVRERVEREFIVNMNWHSQTSLIIKRANRWFPVIEPILRKEGVPDDFKYLAVAESALTNDVSPAGASGFWQFMEATAREYGLEIDNDVDERYHLEKATEAAARYLKKAREKLGSWTLAAAAYNLGTAGITNQQERQQVTDYYDLLLGEETSRYVPRIIALKYILSDPAKYGYNIPAENRYPKLDFLILKVDTPITNMGGFAKTFGTNYKTLKYYNPWLREARFEPMPGRVYEIKVPANRTNNLYEDRKK